MILRQTWLSWRRRVWSWKRNSAAVRKVLFLFLSLLPCSKSFPLPSFSLFPCCLNRRIEGWNVRNNLFIFENKTVPQTTYFLSEGIGFALLQWLTSTLWYFIVFVQTAKSHCCFSESHSGALVVVVSHRTHTYTRSLTVSWRLCVCVCLVDLPAISITVSAAKWGERHRQPTGMLLLFWGSGSRGPDCFAQGQHDLGVVICILVDCIVSFLRTTQEAWACNCSARIWHQLHTT